MQFDEKATSNNKKKSAVSGEKNGKKCQKPQYRGSLLKRSSLSRFVSWFVEHNFGGSSQLQHLTGCKIFKSLKVNWKRCCSTDSLHWSRRILQPGEMKWSAKNSEGGGVWTIHFCFLECGFFFHFLLLCEAHRAYFSVYDVQLCSCTIYWLECNA